MELSSLAEIMKKNGVVGAGGAGFPSYAKLDKKADTLILNCAECEPLFKVHRQVLASYAKEILFALDEISKAIGAKEVIVAVKGSYKNTLLALDEYIGKYKNFTIKKLPEIYPAGDEVITTYEATGRVVPPGKIPISVGVIVYNVETMLNTYYALKSGKPVTTKYVTVAGEVENPQTFVVPVGTRFSELIKLAGGETIEDAAYLNGGVMTGKLANPNDVVTKTTNAILVVPKDHAVISKRLTNSKIALTRAKGTCCQCRMCTDLCPRHLLGHPIEPHQFMRAAANDDTKDINAFVNTLYCSSCGLCEMYSCGQLLSPRSLIDECKTGLKSNGFKPEKEPEFNGVSSAREYRKVPMKRLITRLGLQKYNVSAPIMEEVVQPKNVKIMLSQHIGAPAVAVVKPGDKVECGQMIATVSDKLGADVHSSINGVVEEVANGYILIERTN